MSDANAHEIPEKVLVAINSRRPWKSEFSKECVTTHRPKQLALKMDDAVALNSYSAVKVIIRKRTILSRVRGSQW